MSKYSAEDVKVMFGDIVVGGFASENFVQTERLWYRDVEGKPYTIWATCQSGHVVEVPFNELGYEKHIKPMKPTLESPFKYVVEK